MPPTSPGLELSDKSYTDERATFRTKLRYDGPSPQSYKPVTPPDDVRVIDYTSGDLMLKAWVSAPPDGGKQPAVLFLHGGFAFDLGDWEMAKPYRDAGFAVLMPMLRGENGMPGKFSLYFHEVDDAVAAAEALARLSWVQADQLYVAGHSAGGTLALLVALRSDRFRAAASFSGDPDQIAMSKIQPDLFPFDPSDVNELRIRSPMAYATGFRCNVRLYYGTQEKLHAEPNRRLAQIAQTKGLDVYAMTLVGDHFSYVPAAIKESIAFFRQHR